MLNRFSFLVTEIGNTINSIFCVRAKNEKQARNKLKTFQTIDFSKDIELIPPDKLNEIKNTINKRTKDEIYKEINHRRLEKMLSSNGNNNLSPKHKIKKVMG